VKIILDKAFVNSQSLKSGDETTQVFIRGDLDPFIGVSDEVQDGFSEFIFSNFGKVIPAKIGDFINNIYTRFSNTPMTVLA